MHKLINAKLNHENIVYAAYRLHNMHPICMHTSNLKRKQFFTVIHRKLTLISSEMKMHIQNLLHIYPRTQTIHNYIRQQNAFKMLTTSNSVFRGRNCCAYAKFY